MSEIKIEVGTFPTRDEGLPTMGLMIQTPNPVDIKNEIERALKFFEHGKKLNERDTDMGDWIDNALEIIND